MTYQARLRLVSLKVSCFSLGMVALFPFISSTFLIHLCREVCGLGRESTKECLLLLESCRLVTMMLSLQDEMLTARVGSQRKYTLTLVTGVQSYDFIWKVQ